MDFSRKVTEICATRVVLFALMTLAMMSPAYAQISIPLTIQEAVYTGAPTTGINRSQGPVTVGIPLSDFGGVSSVSQLGLSGASVGQFRVLSRWPSGNIQWVLVDTQADVPAGGNNTSISVVNGSGNFGGPNLATDNGSNITVNTGVAQFTIRKAYFNLFDSAVVNGKALVATGTSPGLVLMGPAPGNTSCGVCTTPYISSNDSHSTAVVEENGPVRAVVRADGSHVDASGNIYMHFTVRLFFYKGKSFVRSEVILRNADESNTMTGDFNSAFKGFTSYEARVTPTLGGGRNYSIASDSATVSGAFSGSEDAYLYQAYSTDLLFGDWYNMKVKSPIARTGTGCGMGTCASYTYAQDGYQIIHGATVLASGDHTKYPQGWADLTDSSGAGIEVGVYQLSGYWPKSLQLVSGGSQIKVGIWPDQSLFNSGGGQPYYQAWPFYSVHDLFFDFHDTALASPANDFLSFQHYLVARAPISAYNDAGVFFYPLLDPSKEDAYFNSLKIRGVRDVPPKVFRFYGWGNAGAGNQHELRWSDLRNFLERGYIGRYLFAAHFYRMVVEHGFVRSDGFDWRNHPVTQLNPQGFPTIASANSTLANTNWVDDEHAHWYGMPDYYFMTGDEAVKDQLNDGVKDRYLNTQISYNNGFQWATRDIGENLMSLARLYLAYRGMGDPDANGILTVADQVLNKQVFPDKQVSGFGTAKQGISRARGIHWGCCQGDAEPNGYKGRVTVTFHSAVLEEGMYELAKARGPSWSNYNLTMDLAYGSAMWAFNENYGTIPGQIPSAMTNGFRYMTFLDYPNNSPAGCCWWYKPGNTQTEWFHFFMIGAYTGDTSWQPFFNWYLQRSAANGDMVEFGSHMMEAVLSQLFSPPAETLIDVPVSVNGGSGTPTLSWTVPKGAVAYRIKYNSKNIVPWLNYDSGISTFGVDPNANWPWFSSPDVPNVPAPASAGTTQTFTASGINAAEATHFEVKAYVQSADAPVGFRIAVSPNNQTVAAGQNAVYTISVAPQGTVFNGAVTFSCSSGLPAGASCAFSPASVTPGSTVATTTLTVSGATSASVLRPGREFPLLPLYALGICLPGIALIRPTGSRRKNEKRQALRGVLAVLLLSLGLLCSCGGGSSTSGGSGGGPTSSSASGTYTITVVGSSGNQQQSDTATLVVQ